MITTPLLLDLAANVASAVIYRAVGRLVAARPVESKARLASGAFAAWWYVLAFFAVYGAFGDVVTMADRWTVPILVAVTHVILLVLLVAIGALVYYLVYLYTGREWTWKPLLAFYGLFWVFLVYWIESLHPNGLKAGPLSPTLAYETDPTGSAASTAIGLLLILPIIAAAFAYFTLFFRAKEPTQRYRIAVVSLSILLWFSFSLVGSLAGVSQSLAWIILSRAVSLGAAASVYFAYRPPAWVRRRYHVEGIARSP